ncbi:MAG: exosortase [Pseudomonadota bacterium]
MVTPASDASAAAAPGQLHAIPLVVSTLVAVAAAGVLLWPSLSVLHVRWTTGFSYTHGYLVLAMAVGLGVHAMRRTGPVEARPFWLALPALLVASSGLVVAQLVSIDVLQQLALPALVALLSLAVVGFGVTWRLLPALAFIYFAMPVWDVLVWPLQAITTAIVGFLLQFHRFPVAIDGFQVSVPAGEFVVAGGCSGLHFVVVGLAVAAFYAMTEMRTLRGRVIAMSLALLLSLVTNWVRVYTLVVVGQLSEMQHYLITEDHYFFGWVLFGVAMFAFFWIMRRIEPAPTDDTRPLSVRQASTAPTAVILSACALLAPVLASHTWFPEMPSGVGAVSLQPTPGWQVVDLQQEVWRPVQSSDAVTAEGSAESRLGSLGWYIARYPEQKNNSELMAWGNSPYAKRWRSVDTARVDDLQISEIVSDRGQRRLVAWRQLVAGRVIHGRLEGKLAQLAGLLRRDRSAEIVAVSAPCVESCDGERAQFEQSAMDWFSGLRIETTWSGDET